MPYGEDIGIVLEFPYSKAVVDRLKTEIPKGHRQWMRHQKAWWISRMYEVEARQILADEWGGRAADVDPTPESAELVSLLRRNFVEAFAVRDSVVIPASQTQELTGLLRRNR